jgi:hypothetical protein
MKQKACHDKDIFDKESFHVMDALPLNNYSQKKKNQKYTS